MTQHFEHHLFFCTNRREPGHARGCCAEKGAEQLRDYAKKKLKEMNIPKSRVNMAGCLDRCELGPVLVIYPEGAWYRYDTAEDIDRILEEHVRDGKRVKDLWLEAGQKRLL
ncbi:MAG: (2Fe-2S) ferredoxin domain-containing protein [Alphaproteobacteria bacterium]|nr:(2Fe-2S) ferredoxin domain-containing protein [Alphaproteobacteria bacterium]